MPEARMEPPNDSRLTIVPIDWHTARGFVTDWHRHNAPPVGWRFGIGVVGRRR